MTITVSYGEADYREHARKHYYSDESRSQWKSAVAGWVIACFFLSVFLFASLAWPLALGLIVCAPTLVGLVFYFSYPLYVRRSTEKWLTSCNLKPFRLVVDARGLTYADSDCEITYGPRSLRGATQDSNGSIDIQIIDSSIHVPRSSFATSEERDRFAAAIHAFRQGNEDVGSWWTQHQPIGTSNDRP